MSGSPMADDEPGISKVRFPLSDEGGGIEFETLWASQLENGEYKLDNCPFYAYGVSLGDTVLAVVSAEGTPPTFQEIVSKSGNRTVRILFELSALPDVSGKILDALVQLGCGYEGASPRYFAVNVPALVDLSAVSEILTRAGVEWELSDPQAEQRAGSGPLD